MSKGAEEFNEDEEMLEDAEGVAEAEREVFGPDVNVIAEIKALQLEDDKEQAEVCICSTSLALARF